MKIHEIMEKMDERRKIGCGINPVVVIVLLVFVAALAALGILGVAGARKRNGRVLCTSNVKCIGVAISMYENRYRAYPPGIGRDFLDNMRRGIPDIAQDGLFVCYVKGGKPGPGVCDYRGPSKAVSNDLPANTMICSDYPDNHGPQEDVNVLYFDGHVDVAWYGSTGWRQADKETR